MVYSSASELCDPTRFVRDAAADLRRSFVPAWHLFRSNLRVRYRRSWLGYLWLLLPSIATTMVWVYVQSRRIVDVAPTHVPYPLYVLAGIILWQVFVDAFNAPLQQLTGARQLITRSRVPHEALILAGTYEVLLNCAVRLLVLIPLLAVWRAPVGAGALLVPIGVGALLLFGLALGLFAAPFGMLYDDVGRAMTLLTGLLFFLTPVIYSTPPAGIVRLNPITPLLDTTRAWLTSGQVRTGFLTVSSVALIGVVIGLLFERLTRPHIVARLG